MPQCFDRCLTEPPRHAQSAHQPAQKEKKQQLASHRCSARVVERSQTSAHTRTDARNHGSIWQLDWICDSCETPSPRNFKITGLLSAIAGMPTPALETPKSRDAKAAVLQISRSASS